jgi:toxin FitB
MRALLDSNIVIYLLDTQYAFLSDRLVAFSLHVSEISRLEVLGYAGLSPELFSAYEALINKLTHYAVTSSVMNQAISLRRQRKMSIGDALIAATALEQ